MGKLPQGPLVGSTTQRFVSKTASKISAHAAMGKPPEARIVAKTAQRFARGAIPASYAQQACELNECTCSNGQVATGPAAVKMQQRFVCPAIRAITSTSSGRAGLGLLLFRLPSRTLALMLLTAGAPEPGIKSIKCIKRIEASLLDQKTGPNWPI